MPALDRGRLIVVRGADVAAYAARLEALVACLSDDNGEERDRLLRLVDALRAQPRSWLVAYSAWRHALVGGGSQPFPDD